MRAVRCRGADSLRMSVSCEDNDRTAAAGPDDKSTLSMLYNCQEVVSVDVVDGNRVTINI